MQWEKWDELNDQYTKKFGSGFPTMCFQDDTPEEHLKKLEQCLESGKTAQELFGLDYQEQVY